MQTSMPFDDENWENSKNLVDPKRFKYFSMLHTCIRHLKFVSVEKYHGDDSQRRLLG